jgi:hypothetical protein
MNETSGLEIYFYYESVYEHRCIDIISGNSSVNIVATLREIRPGNLNSISCVLWRIDPLLGNDSINTFPREPTRAKVGRLLLGNGSVNTPKIIRDNRRRCFPCGPARGYIRVSSKGAVSCEKLREFSWRRVQLRHLSRILSSSGDGSRRWLRRNCKKWMRLCKEDFICDSKLQWDGYKSVARIRQVKTENTNACAKVNCEVCRSAIALYCL